MSQFMSLCASEMGDQSGGRELLLDIWRSLNLMHLCTYCLADEKRIVYSFDAFLIPVAEAFGPHDGHEQLGMFRRAELSGLGKQHLIPTDDVRFPTSRVLPHHLQQQTIVMGRGHLRNQAGAEVHDADSRLVETEALIGDLRGDMRSDAALCHQMYTGRLYRLVREAIKHKLVTAAWPVWGAVLNNVCISMGEITRRAHYRMPKVYRMSVQFVVLTTLAADSFIVGSVVGRVYEQGYAYADGAAAFATILLLTLIIPTTLLIAACIELEEPFGDNLMDVPGLSYVRAAAEVTLNIAAPHPTTEAAVSAAMHVDVPAAIKRAAAAGGGSGGDVKDSAGGAGGSRGSPSGGLKTLADLAAFSVARPAGVPAVDAAAAAMGAGTTGSPGRSRPTTPPASGGLDGKRRRPRDVSQ